MTLNISRAQHSRDPQAPPSVRQVQNLLIAKGYPVGRFGADGTFGQDSETATCRYQAHEGLVRDGVVGRATFRQLNASQPTRTATATDTAARMAHLAQQLLTVDGLDGTRPRYVFGAEANMHDPSPDELDCSEAVQWAVTQVTGKTWVDGSANQYSASRHITVSEAIRTTGALLFITGNGMPSGIHHVAISLGNGMTAEARSTKAGCGSWDAAGRFNYGALIPVLHY